MNVTPIFQADNPLLTETYKVPFTIQNYITSLILPKCIMVHGEVIATVYLQIALNINHQKKIQAWKTNSSWIQPVTIAKNTGYNGRTVSNAIRVLESIGLIKTKKQGKLNVFSLKNNHLKNMEEIITLNKSIELKLLSSLDKDKSDKYITLFLELDEAVGFKNGSYNKDIEKSIWFADINLLRIWITKIENVYKGSSLFFINNIASQLFKKKQRPLTMLSEKNRALLVGSSQTTIGRYIDSYIEAGCLIIEEVNINKPIKLGLNYNFIDNENIDKRVVNEIMQEEKTLICPICQKNFNNNRSFGVHISKTDDPQHNLLQKLKKETQCSPDQINQIYLDHKGEFDKLNATASNIKKEITNEYLKVACDCKMSCSECYKNWKTDFYNDCTHPRKEAFINEYEIGKPKKEIEVKKEDFDIVKPLKKKNTNNAPGLLKYFYGLNGGTSPNFGKECSQIKNLLSKGYSESDIKTTLEYLNRKGNMDIRFLNRSINDALAEKQYLEDANKEGTEAYLVKMYYEGLGQTLNIQTIVRDVQKIKETMNTGLDYEQTKLVIQYMIDIKCPTLNFIGSKRTEALTKMAKKNKIQDNPSFFDRDDLVIIQNELINGRTSLKKINDKFKPEARQIAKMIYSENKFASKFTHLEWAWKVGLDLDKEMYQIAVKSQEKESTLDAILNDPKITDEQRNKIMSLKEKFNNWLQGQLQQFAN